MRAAMPWPTRARIHGSFRTIWDTGIFSTPSCTRRPTWHDLRGCGDKETTGYTMALDHYVSQVHLKNFYSPSFGYRMMNAIKKSDLKSFPCRSEDVCRIENGSTNAYLINDREVEEFLRTVEPKYNASVAKLLDNHIDQECIYVIAGFIAYVAICAPAAMRLYAPPLQSLLVSVATVLDKHKLFPEVPDDRGLKSVTELLQDGDISFKVDPKYPQALGIDSILEYVSVLGNSPWEILQNGIADSPFFTSDFPVAIEETASQGVFNKVIPLTPDLAIRIIPDTRLFSAPLDLSFAKFRYRRPKIRRAEIIKINRLIVQCAEDMVFYRDSHKWIRNFVAKNQHYRIETITKRIPDAEGF
jgi:uncharacterized protein DUF4238